MSRLMKLVTTTSLFLVFGFLLATGYKEFVQSDALPRPAQKGTVLPDAVVYSEDGTARPYSAFMRQATPASLVVFNAVCSSCTAEAMVWDSLAADLAGRMSILAIACTPDRAFGSNLRASSRLSIDILRCDDSFPRTVGATGLPTVYVINSERRVIFSDAGPSATANLVKYLREWAQAT